MSDRIPESDPYDAQTGFDEDWESDDLDDEFEPAEPEGELEDEIDIEEDRARER